MSERIWETVTYFVTDKYIIRVWREDLFGTMGPDKEILDFLSKNKNSLSEYIFQNLENFDRINDIEIRDFNNNGACLYPKWP